MKKYIVSLVLVISISTMAYIYFRNINKTKDVKDYEYTLRIKDNCCKPADTVQNKSVGCPYLDSIKTKRTACKH